jgi:predicted RND superfamily exporter protein
VVLNAGLGIIEALSLAIVVGLSVDYVIHLGHAYNHSILIGRYLRSRSALDTRASSVVSAGISSIGAISVLFFCDVQVFPSFAMIFVMLIGYSLLWSLIFFTSFLMVCGPAARKRLQDSFKVAGAN